MPVDRPFGQADTTTQMTLLCCQAHSDSLSGCHFVVMTSRSLHNGMCFQNGGLHPEEHAVMYILRSQQDCHLEACRVDFAVGIHHADHAAWSSTCLHAMRNDGHDKVQECMPSHLPCHNTFQKGRASRTPKGSHRTSGRALSLCQACRGALINTTSACQTWAHHMSNLISCQDNTKKHGKGKGNTYWSIGTNP